MCRHWFHWIMIDMIHPSHFMQIYRNNFKLYYIPLRHKNARLFSFFLSSYGDCQSSVWKLYKFRAFVHLEHACKQLLFLNIYYCPFIYRCISFVRNSNIVIFSTVTAGDATFSAFHYRQPFILGYTGPLTTDWCHLFFVTSWVQAET